MNVQRVPAYMDVDGVKTEIGSAMVDNDMRCVTLTLKTELPNEVRNVFIRDESYSFSIDEPPIDPSQLCSEHKPKQHRDFKPPWCNKCGLTAEYELPVGRFQQEKEESSSDHDFVD